MFARVTYDASVRRQLGLRISCLLYDNDAIHVLVLGPLNEQKRGGAQRVPIHETSTLRHAQGR